MSTAHFVLTGITGFQNRGVEALVTSTILGIRRHFPAAEITVVTRTPEYDALRLGSSAQVVFNTQHYLDEPSIRGALSSVGRKLRIAAGADQTATVLRTASCVVALGGDVFGSDYGSLEAHLRPLRLALRSGIPVAMLAHSIGPFRTGRETEAWLAVAKACRLITVRERLSYEYLISKLGLSPDRVTWTADLAFLLPVADPEEARRLARHYGLDTARPRIAVAPSQSYPRFTHSNADRHLDALVALVAALRSKLEARVFLVPHAQSEFPAADDMILARAILARLGWDPEVVLLSAEHTASEYKTLIAQCDLVFAERMHAAIAGFGSGICTIPASYSVKADGITGDILGGRAAKHIMRSAQLLDHAQAEALILERWQQRAESAAAIAEALPAVRQRAEWNLELLKSVIA